MGNLRLKLLMPSRSCLGTLRKAPSASPTLAPNEIECNKWNPAPSQRDQYPFNKEYTANYRGLNIMI